MAVRWTICTRQNALCSTDTPSFRSFTSRWRAPPAPACATGNPARQGTGTSPTFGWRRTRDEFPPEAAVDFCADRLSVRGGDFRIGLEHDAALVRARK